MSSAPNIARYAARYCEIGMALTWTAPGAKGPRHAGWNLPQHAITAPAEAFKHWSEHPTEGIAALLGPSGLVSIDVDDEERSQYVLGHLGVDLEELRWNAPCIVGRHFRLMYRAPDVELKHRTLAWPKQDDVGSTVIVELRAGAIADTLPPTRHVGTGQSYGWEIAPRQGFPPLPAPLLDLWEDWPNTQREALALCSWAPPPVAAPTYRTRAPDPGRTSVIEAFNAAHDVGAILQAYGYVRRGQRFASPSTDHAAGIKVLESGKIYCHHAGDPLASEHALDSFDVYRLLEHQGDTRSAVREAARLLGLQGNQT
jgi:putative DNA primase/helicase